VARHPSLSLQNLLQTVELAADSQITASLLFGL